MSEPFAFRHRVAMEADIPAIMDLMKASIAENMKAFLSAEEIVAAQESMGLDRSLINDGTYFVIETDVDGETVMAACGGWGKRRTLYGGDQTAGRAHALEALLVVKAYFTGADENVAVHILGFIHAGRPGKSVSAR